MELEERKKKKFQVEAGTVGPRAGWIMEDNNGRGTNNIKSID